MGKLTFCLRCGCAGCCFVDPGSKDNCAPPDDCVITPEIVRRNIARTAVPVMISGVAITKADVQAISDMREREVSKKLIDEACDLTDRREKPVSLFHGTPLTEHRSSSWYEGPETNSASYRCSCGWAGELYDNSSVCKSASAFEEASHHKASHENCNWASLAPFDEVAAEQYRVLLSLVREPDGACYCSPGYAQAQWKEPQIVVLYRSARQYAGGIYSEFYWALATETKGWEGFDEIHSLFADPAFRAEHQLERSPTEALLAGLPDRLREGERIIIQSRLHNEDQPGNLLFHGTPGLRHYEMLSETIDDPPGESSILMITRDVARGG